MNNIVETKKSSDITFLKDSQWAVIDSEPCKVIDFYPFLHLVKDGKVTSQGKETYTPYASIVLECIKLPKQKITGFITNKLDFINLWTAFKERGIKPDEEVIAFWSKKHYKVKWLKYLPSIWPKLWIMICHNGAYKLMTDQDYKPELTGEARFLAQRSIIEWKPEIIE